MNFLSMFADPQMRLVFFIIFGCCFIPIFVLVIVCFIKLVLKHKKKVNDFKKANSNPKYLEFFGGDDNVVSVSKNLSRVTVEVKDVELVNLNALKEQGIGVMITGNTIKCSSQTFADQIQA